MALEGKPLRYLIGGDDSAAGKEDEITELGFDAEAHPKDGIGVKYCNLFDEKYDKKKRVFAKSSGRFLGWKLEKAVYCLGILHYGRAWNLASLMDGASSEAEPATVGCVCVPWFSTGANSTRNFR
jgi:hypothetical protein